ncbi:DUF4199 domain-containing protein [Aquimarina macrocephali]|uniref:DUF4199 domain-containing protein n=1 Tax=Aquimarina macrocephali TaxID=666563 RepID=UPI000466054C|nr:DUF4199 domain-containing protein [Aquimarina macrocephali]
MENNKISAGKHIVKYGIILGVTPSIYGIILYLTDNLTTKNWGYSIVTLAVLIGVITYGIYTYKSNNNGFLKLGKALKIGMGISLVGGIIIFTWYLLLYNIIEPDMINQSLDSQRERMILHNPNMSPREVLQAMEQAEKLSSSFLKSLFSIIENLFLGFIISFITGAILHKKQNL